MSLNVNVVDEVDPEARLDAEAQISTGRGRLIARRFLRNRGATVGLIVVILMFVAAFVGPLVDKWQFTDIDFENFQTGPSGTHWFGTTQTGQDLFAMTMHGLQKSLIIGLVAGVLTTVLAAVIGAFAGYYGGWTDRILSWGIDLFLVLPSFLMLSILSPWFKGKTWLILIPLLAAFAWMVTARIVRAQAMSLKSREFVSAARFMGVPGWRIIARHILPNIASLLIIDATLNVAATILSEVGLSFFGFGIQPPDVSLGTLINTAQQDIGSYQWLLVFPMACLIILLLAVNLIGDGLRDALDPNAQGAKKKISKAAFEAMIKESGGPGAAGSVEAIES
ncbi:MAG TPA: ABC transporter permease [Actinospica sp.]|nr:ABC transporter permease [Actinospica sp.]